jgi:hypothetical protein
MAKNRPLTWRDVVNNFLLRLISTGQLPFVAFLLVLVLLIYRTPAEHIPEVWRLLQQMLDRRSGLGYSLAAMSSGGWIVHARYQRRRFEKEHDRISQERNEAQQLHFEGKLKSSRSKS